MFFLLFPLELVLLRACFKPVPALRVPSLRTFKAESKGRLSRINLRKLVPFLLYSIGGVMLIVALAGPREGMEEIRRRADGIDIMVALDLSGSMRAIDVPPGIRTERELEVAMASGKVKDRLGTAKEEIAKFIKARPNDRIGLIAFAPLPYVVCPPTLDHAWLIANLDRLESGSIGDATGIAGPVASAVQRLKDSDSKRSIIVLFTDGANNVNAKITPRQAAKLANTFDITLYTVGIGSRNSVMKLDSMFGSSFQRVEGSFDEKLLQEMADTTGGVYYKAADGESMAKAMAQIDQLEKTSVEQNIIVNWKEFYPLFCWLAIAFLLIGFAYEHALRVSVH